MFSKIFALVKKDFLNESSYRLLFFFNIFSILSTILIYFFIDKLFGNKMTAYLETFGVNYFPYVLVSMACFSFICFGIGSFAARIRYEQLQGTLEMLTLTPTSIYTLFLGMGLWNCIIAFCDILIYIGCALWFFNINFSHINILSTTIVLLLTIIGFSSVGITSASFILMFKQANPLGWLANSLEGLLGGVYFPITVLPPIFQTISNFLPITHAIRAMELAVWKNASLAALKFELLFLLVFCFIMLPTSIISVKYAINQTRRCGSLCQY